MNKNDKTVHLFLQNGNFMPVAYTDLRISRWDWVRQEYNYLSALSVKIYPKDLKISDAFQVPPYLEKKEEKKKRGVIKKYSFGASKRCKMFMRNTGHLMKVMITLTYPKDFSMDGEVVKEHLHKFLGWLRYHGYRYIWVLEFQERGAPHFHVLVDKEIPYQNVADYWYKVVDSKDEKHLKAGTKVEAIRAKDSIGHYLTSYMEKSKQKTVPVEYEKVGRFWGSSKGLLEEKLIKIYGAKKDIDDLKKGVRVVRRYCEAQKRSWDKKAREKGKKIHNFKKYYNKSYHLHVVNSDKMNGVLKKHNINIFPYGLTGIQPVPPPPVDGRGGWWSEIADKKDVPKTEKMEWEETYDEWLNRMGLY
jgi:hypothetical protein